ALLAEDAPVRGDGGEGGGRRTPVRGRVRCMQAMRAGLATLERMGTSLRRTEVNGEPGMLVVDGEGRLLGVVTVDVADGCVCAVNSIFNPDKLRHLGPVADRDALLAAARERARRTP